MFGQDRNQLRQYYFTVWNKANAPNRPALEPLEKLVADVIGSHPEYQPMLARPDAVLEQDFQPEGGHSNPFLHMGMHIAIQEQLSSGRPAGITAIWAELTRRHGNPHDAEHLMMECLADMLWQAQRSHQEPDEGVYLQSLSRLLGKI